jgi:methionyl-tRNA synthetase
MIISMSDNENKNTFYITTPIYYVNDDPHIGHAYTTILADVLARYRRADGQDVFFLTGLDEHGQKVQQAADARGIDPQEHCDDMAPRFIHLWEKLHIEYDDFIRTTELRHEKVVRDVLKIVFDAGDIYFDEYGGFYCVGCERFYTEKELEDGKCPQHQIELKYITEKNYFFRMSKYQDQLVRYINDHPEFLQPVHRKNEILGFLRRPLEDLCISRPKTRLSWGIELPFDTNYVTYVWFDALLNYITAPGYGVNDDIFNKWWSASVHLIGKDILMTHAVYWPTMLLSAGIDLPQIIFAHGWWMSGESKMSKSLGNVVNPLDLVDEYGVDPVRYYLMREMVLGQDASFTMESFTRRYNSDLANDFGNLLSRVSRLIDRNFGSRIPPPGDATAMEKTIRAGAEATMSKVRQLVNTMRVNEAIEETMQFIRSVNRYMEQQAPWKLVKSDKPAAGRVLYTAAEALRISSILLSAIMPKRTQDVLIALGGVSADWSWGQLKPGTKIKEHPPLFPRINVKKLSETPDTVSSVSDDQVNVITFEDFQKIEMKTAKVMSVERVKGADRLLLIKIEVGQEQRQIVAGIADYYAPEDIVGKMIVIVANLKPAIIRGLESNGMLLAASKGKKLALVTLESDQISSGVRVF